jgi:3-(3-hydroxy-phenyl)propionate hydroxylase
MTLSYEYDVIVVGYGPTGQVLAASLGLAGHRVAVVERWPTLYGLPRLSHIDDETARIVQALADVDVALRDADAIGSYTFMNGLGEVLTVLGSDDRSAAEMGPAGYPRDISIFQPDIEAEVDLTVRRCESVTRFLGYEAVALEKTPAGAALTITARPESGQDQTIRLAARFVVGADGARSFVREAAGITRTDHGFNERWLNIDVLRLRPVGEKFSRTVQICDPARGHMHLPMGTKRIRFEMALLPGEDAEAFSDRAFAWAWLAERHGLGPEDVEIIRQVVYTFEARIADRWRDGAILLAGDAAHTMPPYLGQGACSGMRDGFNLGWKLDLILRGIASTDLLDTYEVERRPHVTSITLKALEYGKIANEHDPERARERDEMLKIHQPQPFHLPTLGEGLIATGARLAGAIWPQGEVGFGGRTGRFDTVVGNGVVLMSTSPVDQLLGEERLRKLASIGCHVVSLHDPAFKDLNGTYARYFQQKKIAVLLARPDFSLFGASANLEDASHLVDVFFNALAGTEAKMLDTTIGAA